MHRPFALALLCASSLFVHLAAQAGEIRLYTDDNFKGRVVVLRDTTDDLSRVNFNDTVSSIQVDSGSWEVCTHADFKGDCKTLERGDYRSMPGMNDKISSVRELGGGGSSGSGGRRAALELFADAGQRGASAGVNADRDDLVDIGFNDRASSARVEYGYWQLCSDSNYHGSCRVFGPGSHDDLGGLNGRVSSARLVDPREENRPRNDEGLVVLYGRAFLKGRGLQVNRDVSDLVLLNFNDQAESLAINEGTWEVCSDSQFNGSCERMGPGRYETLNTALDKRISSLRRLY
ncbi:beta/gamma crystallin family protein [Janthinobacterium sp. GW458P]|uniref:beta/gamma crystallin-related protein n=1 Tax=Janthinobacterium sp. GW458P TaxID=1981504 RepID=UPI001865AEB7|nr:beta/gamma crystallin-related protein [Janthinobacterium sp. GW458P]MBE3026319.1 beta/gamma crystallin family protein [Janthinobacterium sp. GW458P]